MIKKYARQYLVLILAFIAVIAYHYFAYVGHYGYDDLNYSRIAVNLNNGVVDYNDHFTFRFPLVYLTAISYRFFGTNDFASSVPPIFITLLILMVVYLALRKKQIYILMMGLGLTLFNQWFLFYSDKLMPDIYVAFSVIFSLFVISKYKYESDKSKPWLYAVLLSAGLLFGFMSKGTIILIIPLLLYIFIVDVFLKRDVKFWLYSILSGGLMLIAYLLLIKYLTGNAMQRFDALLNNSYLNRCSYDKQSLDLLFKRIGFQLYAMFVYTGLITGIAIVIAYFFRKKVKSIFRIETPFSFFLVSTLLLFLSANFMSISLTSYVPMCLDPRHYLFIVPVAAIPASEILYSFFVKRKNAFQLMVVFLFLALTSFFLQGNSFWRIYLPLFILLLFAYFLYRKVRNKEIYIIVFIGILLIYPFNMVKYARKIKYPAQRDFVYKHFINTKENAYIITNDVQKRLGDYYLGFDSGSPTVFLSYNEFSFDTLDSDKKKYLLLNPYTRFVKRLNQNNLPFYARDPAKHGSLIYEDKALKMEVYDISGITNPYNESNRLLYSFNGFESDVKYWTQHPVKISKDIVYQGNNSSIIDEYSATFIYPLDSLQVDSSDKILIRARVYCYFTESTRSKLVITIEPKNEINSWQAFEINKYLKAYSNWWLVDFETILEMKGLAHGSKVKIYIWNQEKDEAYLDNFEISIYRIK